MKTKITTVILGANILAASFLALPIQAAPVSLQQLIDSNGTLTIGDKKFANFGFLGNTNVTDPANIFVETVSLPMGFLGLRFTGGALVAVGSTVDLGILYSAETISGLPLISSVGQSFMLSASGNGGFVVIGETVFDQGFFMGNAVAQSSIGFADVIDPPGEVIQGDQLIVNPPLNQVWVTKDILLVPNDAQSSVGLIKLDQVFCQNLLTCVATNKTVECDVLWNFDLPSATNACCGSNVTITVANTVTNQMGCTYCATRTWIVTDGCGNTNTCSQTVCVVDTTPPTIQCPPNFSVQCLTNVPPCPTTLAQFLAQGGAATDNCDTNLTYTCSDGPLVGGICGGAITRTHCVTDDCTNTTCCIQIITVNDTIPPVIVCPPSFSVQCFTNVPPCPTSLAAFLALGGTASDNCDSNLTYTCSDGPLIGGICGGVIFRTHCVTDDCTNTACCIQIITVNDTIPPVISCPPNFTVQCLTNVPPCPTSLAAFLALGGTASDNCDSNLTYTCVDGPPIGICPTTISRIHCVTDDCTNTTCCIQIITVLDTIPPIIQCPPDIMVGCDSNDVPPCPTTLAAFLALGGMASDNCDTNLQYFCVDGPLINGKLARTHTVCDDCTNCASCVQIIMLGSNVPPILICPPDLTVQCTNDVPPAAANLAQFFASGGFVSTTNLLEFVCTNSSFAGDRCNGTITRVYRITDSCSNTVTCVQLIKIQDTTAPNLICRPDKEVQCGTDWFFDIPTATDNCDGPNVPIMVVSTVTNLANPRCPRIFSVTRTWKATDSCTNMAFCNQTVTIVDTEPPNITCEQDKEELCGIDWAFDIPSAVDKCDLTNVVIEVVSTVTNGASPRCPRIFSVTRTWKATDTCGNMSFCNQTVTIVDIEPPNITCEQDKEVQCGTDWFFDIPTAVDKCDLNNVLIEVVSTVTNVAIPRCPRIFSVTRTWKATDTCGNMAFCNQTVTIVDTEPPNITCEQDKEVQCGTDWAFEIPTAVDKCDLNNVLIEVVSTVTNVAVPRCPRIFSVTRTWRATDTCGNSAFCNQTVTIVDTEPPDISCGPDKSAQWGTDWAFDIPTAVDKCDLNNVLIEVVATVTNVANPRCPKLFSVIRIWRATDTCGNSAFCGQTVTIVDTLPPDLACGPDKEVQCGTDWAFDIPTAVDLCDLNNVLIEVVSTVTNVAVPRCPRIFSVTRTWRATDTCGNSEFCNQTVTIVDTEPPNITCEQDKEVQCGTDWAFDIPTAVDKCGGFVVTLTPDQEPGGTGGTGAGSGTVTLLGNTLAVNLTFSGLSANTTAAHIHGPAGRGTNAAVLYPLTLIPGASTAGAINQVVTLVAGTGGFTLAQQIQQLLSGLWYINIHSTAHPGGEIRGQLDGTALIEVVSTVTNVASPRCPRIFSVTRTWKATDACNNMSFCNQTVTIVDTEPPDIHCTPDKEAQWGDDWSFDRPTAVDKCDGTNVVIEITSTVTNVPAIRCPQLFSVRRTWKATDSCGNMSFCSQTVTIIDTLPPDIHCTPDKEAQWGDDWSFDRPTAVDKCDGTNVVIEITSTVTNVISPRCPALFSVRRTWKATDSCGNMSFCSQTVTIIDTLPPDIHCTPDKEAQWGDDWSFDRPTAVDKCDGTNVVIEITSTVTNVISPRCPALFSVRRTWKATDSCGNMSFCSQTVTIIDTLPPDIHCTPDKEAQWGDDWSFDRPTAVDKCDGTNVVIEITSTVTNVISPRCPALFSVRRTWKATDSCGNMSFCSQTVTIIDTLPPDIHCTPDKEAQWGDDWSFDRPTAVDKCDGTNVVIEITSTVTNVISPRCPALFSVRRTWKATDSCGNMSFCSQTVTIIDTLPPDIHCTPDKEAQWGDDWSFDRPTAVDKCDGTNVVIEITSTVTNVPAIRCPQLFSVRRTWKATDSCGNMSFCSQTVTIIDTLPPDIHCTPDKEAQWGDDWSFDRPTAVDKCDGTNVVIEITSTVTNVPAIRCPQLFSVRRTWKATDSCGNMSFCSQTVTIVDTLPPDIHCTPDKEAQWGDDWSFDRPTAVDKCDGTNVVIEITSTVTNVPAIRCPQLFSVRRTWKATDSCGNMSFCSQTVTIIDTLPPDIHCTPDKEAQWGDDWSFDRPTAVDKCDGTNVVIEITSTVTNVISPRCPALFSVRRTWKATDSCGNMSFCSQTVTIVDTLPPDIHCTPDKEAQWGDDWSFDRPTAVDKCDGTNVVIEITSTVTNVISPRCPALFSVRRTWKATDTCGNMSFCSQTVTIVDTLPPDIHCTPDKEAQWGSDWSFDRPTAVDKCDGTNVVIEITSTVTNVISPRCPALFSVRRTWKATDTCGNMSFCSQTVTIIDTEPPNITCADDQIVECGNPFAFTRPFAIDLCDGTNVVITMVSTTTNAASPRCPALFTVRRTWSATDTCGNQSLCSQTITIVDTTPPNLTCADDQIVECNQPFAFTPPTAIDACDGTNVVIMMIGTTTNAAIPRCPNLFTVRRTWGATDSCGNLTFCSQTITIVDTTPPNLTCADDQVVDCGTPSAFTPPTAVDLCDGTNVTVTIVSTTTNAAVCPGKFSVRRTWRAADTCNNETFCSQTLTIVDTTPPDLVCAADRIVQCGVPWNFTPPLAVDVCDGTNVTVVIVSTVTNAAVCPGKISATRTWRATDVCGNSALCSQTILVVNTLAPDMACAPDRIVECGTPWNFSPPYAVDICDGTNVVIEILSTVTNALCGQTYAATRTWRAVDECGNRALCSQTITVVDTLPPQLSCAANRVVECGVPFSFNPPNASDLCSGTNVTVVIQSTVTNDLCGDTFSATRTWKATDQCGNMAVCSQTILLVDTLPPVLIGVPGPAFFMCLQDVPPPPAVTAFDVCDTNVTVTFSQTNFGRCPTIIQRCWMAIDDCSNSVTECQYIYVLPNPPVVFGPVDQVVCPGGTATFCAQISSACPTTNQWTKNGVPITGATNACLTITNVMAGDAGQYCIRVHGPCDSVTNCARLTVLTNVTVSIPPVNCPMRGSDVTICPNITGTGPYTCVWRQIKQVGGVSVTNILTTGPNCCLTLLNYMEDQAAVYEIEVTGACNTARAARRVCPTFDTTAFPITPMGAAGSSGAVINVCEGSSVTLCTPAYPDNLTLIYQWYRGAVVPANAIPGAIGRCLTLNNVNASNYTNYCVVVTGCELPCLVTNCVRLEPCVPCIDVTKEADRFTVLPGSTVTYTYCATNCGSLVLTNVKIIDDNFTPDSTNDDIVIVSGLTLLAGERRCFTRTVTVPSVLCSTGAVTRVDVLVNGDIKVTFVENRNNNTYGANTIGWSRSHTFGNLTGSDKAEFQLKNGAGQVVLQFELDYLSSIAVSAQNPCGYASLGPFGGDGGLSVGNGTHVLSWDTSLAENLRKPPIAANCSQYTVDSPSLSDPNSAVWEYRMIYMATVAKAAFGPSGFGSVAIIAVHNSPATTPTNFPCADFCLTNKASIMGQSGTNMLMDMATEVVCSAPECIDVTKQIACLLPGDNCGPFDKVATGIKGDQNPGFCYQITVANCGEVALTNVTVIDDKLGDLTSTFFGGLSGTLPIGGSITRFVKMAWGVDTTNTVTASGRGATTSGRVVMDKDSAVALVDQAGLTCRVTLNSGCDTDGTSQDNHVSLPTNNAPCAVSFEMLICNNGDADLTGVTITAPALTALGCSLPPPFNLARSNCFLYACVVTLRCSNAPVVFDVTVRGCVATNDHCAFDVNGNRICTSTSCNGTVDCGRPDFRLFKSASGISANGQVTYTYTVTNTGGVLLTDVMVTDDNGTPGIPGDDFVVCTIPSLPPGSSASCVRTVTLPLRLCDEQTGTQSGVLITEVLTNGSIRVTFIQDFGVNDNTYGVNSIGWGSKLHKFSNLTGSDQATFQLRNGAGQVALEFKLDYLTAVTPSAQFPAGYRSLGVAGGDGGMIEGNAASVLSWTTSLEQNLNKQPFLGNLAQYTVDSPALSDPNSPLWEYQMIYSAVVDQNAFGASGFGSAMITDQHNSPGKRNVDGPMPCGGCITNVANAVVVTGGQTLSRTASAVVCTTNREPPTGDCPRTASEWKKQSALWPAPYAPNQTVGSIFAKAPATAAGKTLLQALDGKAGSNKEVKDLLKEAVAALLNASSTNIAYPLDESDIIDGVNMALMNGGNQALKSLKDLFKEANENNRNCGEARTGNCDTDGRPNALTFLYNGQSCGEAANAQMAVSGKTSCSGDPMDAPLVRIIATGSSTPPTASSARYFDGMVALNQQFDVRSATIGANTFGANTYFYIYVGNTLVQTIQIHTSCSAPLRRGDTFGSLLLQDYRIEP